VRTIEAAVAERAARLWIHLLLLAIPASRIPIAHTRVTWGNAFAAPTPDPPVRCRVRRTTLMAPMPKRA
jgi:hypothetical protein